MQKSYNIGPLLVILAGLLFYFSCYPNPTMSLCMKTAILFFVVLGLAFSYSAHITDEDAVERFAFAFTSPAVAAVITACLFDNYFLWRFEDLIGIPVIVCGMKAFTVLKRKGIEICLGIGEIEGVE